ncbi:PI-PLC X domain-containing protein 1-like [Erpetoichthys calabaricus]|uniref:Si:dkey-66a8.7 n=1 Tax=Erpetoichthys calabaricus TaxID=27687 RepID=A0A8C4XC03_ERPCA|nr:PI-PLC X domain-containing protein 1-like [Erpetoichthys calabaricus]XP_028655841.1 PI-PLC X domain-containing protein 1-like [Erpetoichthys calabaricus]
MAALENIPLVHDECWEEWMSLLPQDLWDVPLYNLAIPGSHDAMSYCLDLNSPIVTSQPWILKMADHAFPCIIRPVIFKWATTQEVDIVEQLKAGIRYFDLRIAHRPKDGSQDLYYTHVLFTVVTVLEALQEINLWLENHKREIIILACSHFEGMTESLHEHLISSLKYIFGSKLCPVMEDITLRNLWKMGHQVIVSYEDPAAQKHREMWPKIPYWWADSEDPNILVDYFEKKKESRNPGFFCVAGLNLTASYNYITIHPSLSLKKLTLKCSLCLMDWVQQQTPGEAHGCLNIFAGDFVTSGKFISDVITLNKKLIQRTSGLPGTPLRS